MDFADEGDIEWKKNDSEIHKLYIFKLSEKIVEKQKYFLVSKDDIIERVDILNK